LLIIFQKRVHLKPSRLIKGNYSLQVLVKQLKILVKHIVYMGETTGYVGGDVIVYSPKDQNSKFLSYSLNSSPAQYQKSRNAKGYTVIHIYPSNLKNILIPIPEIEEQTQIASFLDHETSRIDTLISKKERQIELLKEKRSALITHAVTKGLNPDAKMKDSDVEWIGEIPAEWITRKLKFIANITTGDKNTEDNQPDGKYPFFVRSQSIERLDTYSFDGEAVLTAGDGVGVGRVFHYYKGKFDFHQRVYAITNFCGINGKYFFYYLKANLIRDILRFNAKSTVDSLRLPMFRNFVVAFPKELNEQERIVNYLDRETSKIDKLISKVQNSIDMLKEYRAAIISAAVTGKIDVRDWKKEAAA